MQKTLEAVYVKGAFRPLSKTRIPEGKHVRLVVTIEKNPCPTDLLDLAGSVYDGLPPDEVAEIERVALDRAKFLTRPKTRRRI